MEITKVASGRLYVPNAPAERGKRVREIRKRKVIERELYTEKGSLTVADGRVYIPLKKRNGALCSGPCAYKSTAAKAPGFSENGLLAARLRLASKEPP